MQQSIALYIIMSEKNANKNKYLQVNKKLWIVLACLVWFGMQAALSTLPNQQTAKRPNLISLTLTGKH